MRAAAAEAKRIERSLETNRWLVLAHALRCFDGVGRVVKGISSAGVGNDSLSLRVSLDGVDFVKHCVPTIDEPLVPRPPPPPTPAEVAAAAAADKKKEKEKAGKFAAGGNKKAAEEDEDEEEQGKRKRAIAASGRSASSRFVPSQRGEYLLLS